MVDSRIKISNSSLADRLPRSGSHQDEEREKILALGLLEALKQTLDEKTEKRLREIRDKYLDTIIYHTEEIKGEPYFEGDKQVTPTKTKKTQRTFPDNYQLLFEHRYRGLIDAARKLPHNLKFEVNVASFLSYLKNAKSRILEHIQQDPDYEEIAKAYTGLERELKGILKQRIDLCKGIDEIKKGRKFKLTQKPKYS